MELWQLIVLAAVQGAAEMLPVSSSAHVIVAEKLMGLDPSAPAMTLLLVLLHTGTMGAVIVHFRPAWAERWRAAGRPPRERWLDLGRLLLATALTGAVGLLLMKLLAHGLARDPATFEVEQLFGNAHLVAAALTAAGFLILASGWWFGRAGHEAQGEVTTGRAAVIGVVQALCLPFRGFSRSGATISAALLLGVARERAEAFSFALAVVLTPPVIAREVWRLVRSQARASGGPAADLAALAHGLVPGLVGMVLAFGAGLLALRWLSSWLAHGRWHWFGVYCLGFAGFVLAVG